MFKIHNVKCITIQVPKMRWGQKSSYFHIKKNNNTKKTKMLIGAAEKNGACPFSKNKPKFSARKRGLR